MVCPELGGSLAGGGGSLAAGEYLAVGGGVCLAAVDKCGG